MLDRVGAEAACARNMPHGGGLLVEVVGGMDSWFFNKIAGAVLSALLVAFGAGTLSDIVKGGHSDSHAKPGFELPPAPAAGGAAAAAQVAFNYENVAKLLKSASADSGKEGFGKCRACHTPDKDGKPGTGPNLWGVLGKNIASNAAFTNYSPAFKSQQGAWTLEKLATYLHDPAGAIPGNKMAFAGVKGDGDLADIMAYLRSLSDNPVPLPN